MRITLATVLTLIVTALAAPAALADDDDLVLTTVEASDRCAPAGTLVEPPTVRVTRGGKPASGIEVAWGYFGVVDGHGPSTSGRTLTGPDGLATGPRETLVVGEYLGFEATAIDTVGHSDAWGSGTVRAIGSERSGGYVSDLPDQEFSESLEVAATAPTELAAAPDGTCVRKKSPDASLDVAIRSASEPAGAFTHVGTVALPADYTGRHVSVDVPSAGTWTVEARIAVAGTPYRTVTQDVVVGRDPVSMSYLPSRSSEGRHGVWFVDQRGRLEVWVAPPDPRMPTSLRAAGQPESLKVSFTDALTGRRSELPGTAVLHKRGKTLSAVIDRPITRRGRFDISTEGTSTLLPASVSVRVRPRPVASLPRGTTRASEDQSVRRRIRVKDGGGLVVRLVGVRKHGRSGVAAKGVRIPASGWVTVTVPKFSGTYVFHAEVDDLSSRGTGWRSVARSHATWTVARR